MLGALRTARRAEVLFPGTASGHERRIWAGGLVNLAAMVVELVGGERLRSAALLSEGSHMGAHVLAMLTAAVGYRLTAAARLRSGEAAGKRVAGAAALVNAVLLLAVAAALLIESLSHIRRPEPIPIAAATILAVFGLLVNLATLGLLHRGPESGVEGDLNCRAIRLHMIGDAGVGVLSLLGLALVASLGWRWADGAAGVGGAVLIATLAAQIVRAL